MSLARWCVLIEEQVGNGEYKRWEMTHAVPAGDDREAAELRAEELSRTCKPQHPMNAQGRTRFRTSEGWVVVVAGAMSQYRFRLTVAEHIPG